MREQPATSARFGGPAAEAESSGRDEEWPQLWGRRLIFWLFFGLPLAMPAHILVNHLTHTVWSWPVAFLYPDVIGTLAVLVVASRKANLAQTWARIFSSDPNLRAIVLVAGAFVAWTALCAILQGAFVGYWVRSLLVGWIFPALLAGALLALQPGARPAAWRGLSAGVGFLLVESLVLYFVSFGVPRSFHELVYINRTYLVFRGLKGGIFFGELTLGNFNDIAVFFCVSIAFASGYALERIRRPRPASGVLLAFVVAALGLEFLCYSRGTILYLALVLGILVISAAVWPDLRRPRLGALVVVFALFLGGVLASRESREYWLAQLRVSRGSSAAVRDSLWTHVTDAESLAGQYRGTAAEKTSEAADEVVARALSKPLPTRKEGPPKPGSSSFRADLAARIGSGTRRLALGYGLGNYGVMVGGTFEAGTHNMFLDAFVASGVPGLILFSGFWLLVLWRAGREEWRSLRATVVSGSAVPVPSVLLAVVAITVAGLIVDFRFVILGMMLNAAVVWLLIVTLPGEESSKTSG